MNKKLPLIELTINEDEGSIVNAVGLVEEPAIESDFIAFAKHTKVEKFVANDEKMELFGAAMIPDIKIYRKDENTGMEYNVFFSKETVRKIAQQYMKYGYQKNLNLHHTPLPAKSYIYQSYIVDQSKGVNAPEGINAPDGSWIIGVKVEDASVWERIKSGEVKGFSIEGVFEFVEKQFKNEMNSDLEVIEILQKMNDLINKIKEKK